jgi:hypothetical protein
MTFMFDFQTNEVSYDEIENAKIMKHLEPIQIDKSWKVQYDHYLKHFSRGHDMPETSHLFSTPQAQIAFLHTMALSNLLNVAKAKRPVQNIYKRPI